MIYAESGVVDIGFVSFEVDGVHRSNGEHRIVDILGAHPVIIGRVPQTATGHVHALVLALTDDHVTYEFVTVEAERLHFVLDHRAELTRQLLDLFRVVRHVFQVDPKDVLDRFSHDPRTEAMRFVRGRLEGVLQFRFRFHLADEHALSAHAHHRVREVAERVATFEQRHLATTSGLRVARFGRLVGEDRDPPARFGRLHVDAASHIFLHRKTSNKIKNYFQNGGLQYKTV